MSDVSQGPGWWQATDDKWYPPQDHPDYQGGPAGAAADLSDLPPPPPDAADLSDLPPPPPDAAGAADLSDLPPPPPGDGGDTEAPAVSTTAIGFGSVPGTPSRQVPGGNITLPPPMPAPGGPNAGGAAIGKPPSQISLTFHSEMYLGSGAGNAHAVRGQLRKHSTIILVGLLVVLLAGGAVAYFVTRPKAAPTAASNPALARSLPYQRLLDQSIAAAKLAGSVHFSANGDFGAGPGSSMGGDIGPTGASFTLTSPDDGNAQLIVSNGIDYALGNVTFLESLGFDAMSATQYQGQWIMFPKDNSNIGAILKQFTPEALILSNLPMTGVITEKAAAIGATPVLNLTGLETNSKSPTTPRGVLQLVSVTTTTPHLPVQVIIAGANGGTMSLSSWGEVVNPAAPPGPLNYVNINTDAQ